MGMLLLVRHGQASFGTDDYDVLSPTGWEQGRLLGAWLAERDVAATDVVIGGLRRHRETLEAMREGGAATAAWPAAGVDPGWDEFDHVGLVRAHAGGDAEVPTDRRAFQLVFEEATRRWTEGVGEGFPETWAEFVGRVRDSLTAAAGLAGSGRTVVVVTSGGPIAVVCALLADPEADPASLARLWQRFNTMVVNTSVTRVLVGGTGARLLAYNEHPHVAGETLTYR